MSAFGLPPSTSLGADVLYVWPLSDPIADYTKGGKLGNRDQVIIP